MPKKRSDVDVWIGRETEHTRKALENASTYFDGNDVLDVHTLEAVYGKESSFGTLLNKRGIDNAAGEFQLRKPLAERYGLIVSKGNDQRFDIDYASIAAARYLKDIDYAFSKRTKLTSTLFTIPVLDPAERKKFDLAAYAGGEGTIAKIQQLALKAGKNPGSWNDVKKFLKQAKVPPDIIKQINGYIPRVPEYEVEFAKKSAANAKAKDKKIVRPKIQCTQGHWITKNDHHIFICR